MSQQNVTQIVWALHRLVIGLVMTLLIGHITGNVYLVTWGNLGSQTTLWTTLQILAAALAGHPKLPGWIQHVFNFINAVGSTIALSLHIIATPVDLFLVPSFFTALSCLFLASSKFYMTTEASFSGINYGIILCIAVVNYWSVLAGRPLVWTALAFSGMSVPTSVLLAILSVSGLYQITVEHPDERKWVVGPLFLISFSIIVSTIQLFS